MPRSSQFGCYSVPALMPRTRTWHLAVCLERFCFTVTSLAVNGAQCQPQCTGTRLLLQQSSSRATVISCFLSAKKASWFCPQPDSRFQFRLRQVSWHLSDMRKKFVPRIGLNVLGMDIHPLKQSLFLMSFEDNSFKVIDASNYQVAFNTPLLSIQSYLTGNVGSLRYCTPVDRGAASEKDALLPSTWNWIFGTAFEQLLCAVL